MRLNCKKMQLERSNRAPDFGASPYCMGLVTAKNKQRADTSLIEIGLVACNTVSRSYVSTDFNG